MAFTLSTEYEALKHDVNTLFSRFYQKQSVRFEDFIVEWKAMNFNCIFAATYRNTFSAKMRIVERLFRVASEFLSEESTFLYRVAAIYMFYAVYYRQISERKVRIRMTPTMWKDLMDFFKIVVEHQHLDVAYIIQKLRKEDAFVFTAFPKFLVFGRHEFMLGIEGISSLRYTHEADKYINDLLSHNEMSQSIANIQKDYEEVKNKVLHESKEEEKEYISKVLYYSNSEFPQELKKMIDTHKTRNKAKASLKPDFTLDKTQRPVLSQLQELKETESNSADEIAEPNRAEMIAKIKEKSFQTSVSLSPHVHKQKGGDQMDVAESSSTLGTVTYQRSAMLKPIEKKPQMKRTLHSRGMRYKVVSKNIED